MRFSPPLSPVACRDGAKDGRGYGKGHEGKVRDLFLPQTQNLKNMEVVIIEKKTFEALLADVGTLMEKVNVLSRKCNDRRLSNWLDGEDVCRMLRISPRTLQTLRDNRLIACSQINRKFFYKPEEVARILPLVDCYRPKNET